MFTEDEKKLLKLLVKKELDKVHLDEAKIIDDSPSELKLEEKYDQFLEKILKKL